MTMKMHWMRQCSGYGDGDGDGDGDVQATAFITRDHVDAQFYEKTIHLAIYTQSMNGERELYRHFLRLHDGTILELFDPLKSIGDDDFSSVEEKLIKRRLSDPQRQHEQNNKQLISELLKEPDKSVNVRNSHDRTGHS